MRANALYWLPASLSTIRAPASSAGKGGSGPGYWLWHHHMPNKTSVSGQVYYQLDLYDHEQKLLRTWPTSVSRVIFSPPNDLCVFPSGDSSGTYTGNDTNSNVMKSDRFIVVSNNGRHDRVEVWSLWRAIHGYVSFIGGREIDLPRDGTGIVS